MKKAKVLLGQQFISGKPIIRSRMYKMVISKEFAEMKQKHLIELFNLCEYPIDSCSAYRSITLNKFLQYDEYLLHELRRIIRLNYANKKGKAIIERYIDKNTLNLLMQEDN